MARHLPLTLLIWAATAWAACSAGPNTQYLPIGERCTSNSDCGTQPYVCNLPTVGYPGGYCTLPCQSSTVCPTDSECVGLPTNGFCRRKCDSDTECRTDEGYACHPGTTTSTTDTTPYCDAVTTTN